MRCMHKHPLTFSSIILLGRRKNLHKYSIVVNEILSNLLQHVNVTNYSSSNPRFLLISLRLQVYHTIFLQYLISRYTTAFVYYIYLYCTVARFAILLDARIVFAMLRGVCCFAPWRFCSLYVIQMVSQSFFMQCFLRKDRRTYKIIEIFY